MVTFYGSCSPMELIHLNAKRIWLAQSMLQKKCKQKTGVWYHLTTNWSMRPVPTGPCALSQKKYFFFHLSKFWFTPNALHKIQWLTIIETLLIYSFKMIIECWNKKAELRPSFGAIKEKLIKVNFQEDSGSHVDFESDGMSNVSPTSSQLDMGNISENSSLLGYTERTHQKQCSSAAEFNYSSKPYWILRDTVFTRSLENQRPFSQSTISWFIYKILHCIHQIRWMSTYFHNSFQQLIKHSHKESHVCVQLYSQVDCIRWYKRIVCVFTRNGMCFA